MAYTDILLIALLLFVLGVLFEIWRTLHRMLDSLSREMDMPEPVEGGMDLGLLKPKPKHKAKRFTDKSRDWITAKETASRR
jgi:hypothetical protein